MPAYKPPVEDEENPIDLDPLDVREFVRLDTTDPDGREAYLRNLVFKVAPIKLRTASWSVIPSRVICASLPPLAVCISMRARPNHLSIALDLRCTS